MVTTADLDFDQLDAIYPKRQLDDGGSTQAAAPKTYKLGEMAVNVVNDIYGGKVRSRSEVEGSAVDFLHWVWAHMIALRQKEETSSESQGGGSMGWARPTGELEDWLSETRFGRTAKGYLRGVQNIGVEKASSSWE